MAHYRALLPETPRFEGWFNVFNLILLTNVLLVALHLAMRAIGKSAAESAQIAYEVVEPAHASIPRVVRWLIRHFLFSRLFLALMRRSSVLAARHPEGFEIRYSRGPEGSSSLCYECTRCGVNDYYRRHGVEKLGQYCNMVDYIEARAFGFELRNPKNIGQGDDACHEHMIERGRTELPDNLRELVTHEMPRAN